MSRPETAVSMVRVALARWTGFFSFWLLLADSDLGETTATNLAARLTTDLAVGLLVTTAAT